MAKYRIVSFDGGGVRGLLSVVLLQQLDERIPGWRDQVDLIAGNSTGGIIALGLAKGLDPERLRELYYDRAALIFRDTLLDDLRDLGNVVGAEYSNRNLREELQAVLGVSRLQDLKRKVLIASFDLDNEASDPEHRSWKPKFFHNFSGEDTDGSERAVDVALYTSAAPTYFPSVDGYIDGGVVANNPSMAALAQTQDERAFIPERPDLEDIVLLSIGTGRVMSRIEGKRRDWGLAQWAKPLVKLMLYGTVGVPDYQCAQMLGERYCRLDYTFPPGREIDIDDYDKRDQLVEIAESRMESELAETEEWLNNHWCPE